MDAASSMEMEQLVAAFAAMSGNNNRAAPPPAAHPVHMEELAAASLTMSGNAEDPAALPLSTLPHDYEETEASTSDGDDSEPGKGEEACVLRVRFPDGRIHCRSFGASRPAAALYRYCRSVLFVSSARGRPFRLVRLAGGASDEVPASSSTSLRDLGLHHCTVHVVLI